MSLYEKTLKAIERLPKGEGLSCIYPVNPRGQVCAIGATLYGHLKPGNRYEKSLEQSYINKKCEIHNDPSLEDITGENDYFIGTLVERRAHMVKRLKQRIKQIKKL